MYYYVYGEMDNTKKKNNEQSNGYVRSEDKANYICPLRQKLNTIAKWST